MTDLSAIPVASSVVIFPDGARSFSPGLAHGAYPGSTFPNDSNPDGVASTVSRWRQPFQGWANCRDGFPGVARAAQPRAEGRNPFGIQNRNTNGANQPSQDQLPRNANGLMPKIQSSSTRVRTSDNARILRSLLKLDRVALRVGDHARDPRSGTGRAKLPRPNISYHQIRI